MLDVRSGRFGYLERHQHFSPLTQLGTLSDKSQPAKVHIPARHDGDEFLAAADEVVADDMGFEACEGEGA